MSTQNLIQSRVGKIEYRKYFGRDLTKNQNVYLEFNSEQSGEDRIQEILFDFCLSNLDIKNIVKNKEFN